MTTIVLTRKQISDLYLGKEIKVVVEKKRVLYISAKPTIKTIKIVDYKGYPQPYTLHKTDLETLGL